MSAPEIVSPTNGKETEVREEKNSYPLQVPLPQDGFYRKPFLTLPSNVAIPVGLAQVFLGGSMVVCGSLALRYRSYLFYYGTGLWAGTISAVTGALVVMATKEGVPKPKWLCGGKKWDIHVVIATTMLAMSSSVLLSIFSTSGLLQDTMHSVGVELGTPTEDEERFERRKSSGVAINAVLLLLAMLEILLTFCSLGIALRVICRSSSASSLFSTDSATSQVTMHDILGSGPEYEARKDRLLRWLGHQRRNYFLASASPAQVKSQQISQKSRPPNKSPSIISNKNGARVCQLVAVQPQHLFLPHSRPVLYRTHSRPYTPYPLMVPLCPAPLPRSFTPLVNTTLEKKIRRERRTGTLSTSSKGSKRSSQFSKERSGNGKEVGLTEEDIGKTYTGLDRTVAEDFIYNSMDKY